MPNRPLVPSDFIDPFSPEWEAERRRYMENYVAEERERRRAEEHRRMTAQAPLTPPDVILYHDPATYMASLQAATSIEARSVMQNQVNVIADNSLPPGEMVMFTPSAQPLRSLVRALRSGEESTCECDACRRAR